MPANYQSVPQDDPSVPNLAQAPPAYSEYNESATENPAVDQFKNTTPVAECAKSIRMAFLRKVYAILTAQLFVTSLFGGIFYLHPAFSFWVQMHPWFLILNFFISLVVLFGLIMKPYSYPRNYIFLFLFTALEGLTLGTAITFFSARIILEAVFITLGVFVALTAFTFQSKWDFSRLGGFLYVSLWSLILTPLIFFFVPSTPFIDMAFAGFGTLVFCGYILFDTYNILHRYSPEEFIMSSLMLYLDFINLFIRILQILGMLQNNDNN
ncbi:hypothetical protein POMI540_4123 [Schizosaccharomyces pombe]|uniref:Bax inhibitor 1 n=1 Tax=Schizosaccharomyces pombe (strain 972 / ATCC 24843) TaxID=284812 RepID=BXI1_SCHPO|nr:BAX inhibitor family protein Bxi1 [Schizosaccharomyces pombe]O74888.1 RecName: Full=Bax inhibitor 1; AltName: Full=BH3 domain-containing protein bxi1 [Schizosaccharomyces pombe 972h-]CAA21183.1 BAX inhibitor family protein Bxi1 [Schizosaccharomyces pombe]|eukprot:NP_588431.1 BAX inhibitor family protein Bxi1 [Schizosaccharomyces pombe]